MRLEGSRSWEVHSDDASMLAMALYVRDAAGLDTSANPDAPPPLEPGVPVDGGWRQRFATAAPAWNAWWARLLRELGTAPTEFAAFEDAVAAATGDARALLDAALPAARTWARERALDRSRVRRQHGRVIWESVRSVEAELGRRAAPFRLTLFTLPVRGLWWRRAAAGAQVPGWPGPQPTPALLLSRQVMDDEAELSRVVRPLIASLA